MILTVCNTKGGVGKTTLALQLAIERARSTGRSVWLIDGDRQGTAQIAITQRAEAGQTPALACSSYVDGPTLRAQIAAQASHFDDVVIDAGGRDSSALRAALVCSDVALVPFQPRSFDVWALEDISGLLEEARAINLTLKAFAVMNVADAYGRDNDDARDALEGFPQLVYLPTPIGRRKAFANAGGAGLSVYELKPKDPKACTEVTAMLDAVFISF